MIFVEGTTARSRRVISQDMVRHFVEMSGDRNPIHAIGHEDRVDDSSHETIVPGLLTASLISALIANELPGPGSIYAAQTLKFVAPVYVGDSVLTEIRVLEFEPSKPRVTLDCKITTERYGLVLIGQAVVVPPRAQD